MIKHTVDLDFVYYCRFAILLRVGRFLGKRLDGELLPIFQTLSQIH